MREHNDSNDIIWWAIVVALATPFLLMVTKLEPWLTKIFQDAW